jgi:hypothetical protein
MPASAAQVFGPVTVDPGFNSTGEKTLLTMNTTLPAGGRNIILVAYAGHTDTAARGTFRIYKGSTLLYETSISGEYFTSTRTRPFHHLLIAVDSSPLGNDSYSFRINITTAGGTSGSVHVQGMVIKADIAVWGYNMVPVSISTGFTATVASITTNFPPGSKVVVVATVYAASTTPVAGNYLVGAGNIMIRSGSSVVSSNQFNIGSHTDSHPLRMSLIYLDIPSSSSQTYSVEITNGSTVVHNCWAEIVAFDVWDAAFLDTGSVAVGTSQITVGNLTTNLSGNVAVIALAAAERTATNDGDTFLENRVVLQKDNSSTDQVGNLLRWYIFRTGFNARSGVLPLFRYDIGVSNPSYQVKMTANSGAPNGEAKILAFLVAAPGFAIKRVMDETVKALEGSAYSRGRFGVVSETMRETEGTTFGRSRFRISTESVRLSELVRVARNIARSFFDVVNIVESVIVTAIGQTLVEVINEMERVTEAFRPLRNVLRRFAENVNIIEFSSRLRSTFRTVAENISMSEFISRARSVARIVGEAVRSLEATVRARIIARAVSEAIHIFEAFSVVKGAVRAIVEGLQLSEAVRKVRGLTRTVAEQVGISELISKSVRFVKILSEALNLPEAFGVVRNRFRAVGESLGITELATVFKGAVRVVGEFLNLEEISQSLRNLFKQVGETINIGEAFARVRVITRAILESVIKLEGWLTSRGKTVVVSEIANIGESLAHFKGRILGIVEVIVVTEIRLFKELKAYIDRLVSSLRGMSRSRFGGRAKGGKF